MKKINLLILLDEIYPSTSANARIGYRIVDELLKHDDIDIKLMGRPITNEEQAVTNYKTCQYLHDPYVNYSKNNIKPPKSIIKKLFFYITHPRKLFYSFLTIFKKSGMEFEYKIEINKLIKANKIDVILACSRPDYTLFVASKFTKKIPVLYYKMDSFVAVNSERIYPRNTPKKEALIDSNVTKIITTSIIYKKYMQYPLSKNKDKVVVLEYPNIEKKDILIKKSSINFDNNKINCVFIGKLYNKIRHPQYLFDLIDSLKDPNIILHIVGGFGSEFSTDFLDKYFSNKHNNIIYHGEVPPEEADCILMQSDILIHIGNTTVNSMPSKILDYISSGKPIVNIIKNKECPTIPYMETYPLSLNLFEEKGLSPKTAYDFKKFCYEKKGAVIPFEEIKKQYCFATKEYVGLRIYNIIKEAYNKN